MSRASFAVLFLLAVSTLEPIVAEPSGLASAIRAHRTLVSEQPGDLEVLNDLGNLLVLAGEMAEAEQVYRQALHIDRDFAEAHYNLALLLHQTQRRRLAKQELHKALELRPDDPWSLYQMGTLYAEGGDRARAIKYYSKAFSVEPRLRLADFNPHIHTARDTFDKITHERIDQSLRVTVAAAAQLAGLQGPRIAVGE